jgi:hypothetical protein
VLKGKGNEWKMGMEEGKNPRAVYLPRVEMGLRKGIPLNPLPNSSSENP